MTGRLARLGLMAGLACLALAAASATELRVLSSEAALGELGRQGFLREVVIDGDLDLARLTAPAGAARLELQRVELRGTLRSSATPAAATPLLIDASTVQAVDLRGIRMPAGLAIESSTILGSARFDDADFAGPFVLHATTLAGKAVFRRARFGAPVEIVGSEFQEPPGMTGGVSFADTRFAASARFDRSRFATDVRFDVSRFDGDASFIGLVVPGRASWRNVNFAGDAEFRFCQLGEVDFGDAEQMSVIQRLGDFRGCTMRSARFDYVDWRGDAMLVKLRVGPGDLSFRQAALRGARTDFSGLQAAGALVLDGAVISAPQLRWPEIAESVLRANPDSAVLRPLHRQLVALRQDEDARDVWAELADAVVRERLADPDTTALERLRWRAEQIVWGRTTGYGTRLGRIVGWMLAAWAFGALPLLAWRGVQLGRWAGAPGDIPPVHRAAAAEAVRVESEGALADALRRLGYAFGLMFAWPGMRLRPVVPLPTGAAFYLGALRGTGALLLVLAALTLANVSPMLQAIVGKVVG